VDDEHIYVGDYCMIAPNVVIATSGHPILPVLRENHYVYNLPVHIGRNVWIGSGVQILPGVTIGDNSVIGGGSVVTVSVVYDIFLRPIRKNAKHFYGLKNVAKKNRTKGAARLRFFVARAAYWRRSVNRPFMRCFFAHLNQSRLSCLLGATKNHYEASRHGWRGVLLFYQTRFIELKVFIRNSYLVLIPLYTISIILLATVGR
jgi:hypothetical protein